MGIAHCTIATREVQRSRDFFTDTLNWKDIDRPGNIESEAAWLQIAPDQELHILHVPDFEPSPFEREFGRHIAIEYPANGFPDLKDRLLKHGAKIIDPIRETPFERFFFCDPNGYVFEVVDAGREVAK